MSLAPFIAASLQAGFARLRSTSEAQWNGRAMIVSGSSRPSCNGVYVRAEGQVAGAPHAKNADSGWVLFFNPPRGQWCISDTIDDAATGMSVANIACDAGTMRVPEGENQWNCFNGSVSAFEKAPMTIAFMPVADAMRRVRF